MLSFDKMKNNSIQTVYFNIGVVLANLEVFGPGKARFLGALQPHDANESNVQLRPYVALHKYLFL